MDHNVKLTDHTRFSGCGAKLGPGVLDKALCELSQRTFPALIVDYKNADDAGVYKLTDEIAIVQTVDYFPPIVDDPFLFGQIAAANALSDVYAMGGKPITALNIVCFPQAKMDIAVLREIIRGGLSKLDEADCALVGGHSIDDAEIKYGLAVTGVVHPEKILANNTPGPGETLILTKPLGTGLTNAALRGGVASVPSLRQAIAAMAALNKTAAAVARDAGASACTDVTGFGLLGHACEMIAGAAVGLAIEFAHIPLIDGVIEYAQMGLIPAGTYRNREYRQHFVSGLDALPRYAADILFDPQTSGGLLFTIQQADAATTISRLAAAGCDAAIIGQTTAHAGTIAVA